METLDELLAENGPAIAEGMRATLERIALAVLQPGDANGN